MRFVNSVLIYSKLEGFFFERAFCEESKRASCVITVPMPGSWVKQVLLKIHEIINIEKQNSLLVLYLTNSALFYSSQEQRSVVFMNCCSENEHEK